MKEEFTKIINNTLNQNYLNNLDYRSNNYLQTKYSVKNVCINEEEVGEITESNYSNVD